MENLASAGLTLSMQKRQEKIEQLHRELDNMQREFQQASVEYRGIVHSCTSSFLRIVLFTDLLPWFHIYIIYTQSKIFPGKSFIKINFDTIFRMIEIYINFFK